MTLYRSKHAVEAMQWDGKNYSTLDPWHQAKTGTVPVFRNGDTVDVYIDGWHWSTLHPGQWLIWNYDRFAIRTDSQFRAEYEEVTNG